MPDDEAYGLSITMLFRGTLTGRFETPHVEGQV
jgi:hypothetical protein